MIAFNAHRRTIGTSIALDPDAQAYLNAAGISQSIIYYPSTAYEITGFQLWAAVNALVLGLKSDGLWGLFEFLYPFVGGTAFSHSWNLINPAISRIIFIESPAQSATGVAWNGTNQQGNTNTSLSRLSLESVHLAYDAAQAISNPDVSGMGVMGCASSATTDLTLYANRGNNNYFSAANNNALVSAPFTGARAGLFIGSRTTRSNAALYYKGVFQASSTVLDTGTYVVNDFISLARPTLGGTVYSRIPCRLASAGRGMSAAQAQAFSTRVNAFQTALKRAV